MVSDALFESYAAEEEAAAARSAKTGSFEAREYEAIKWVGCELNKPTIFRAVGGPPNSKIDNTTARFVTISWIIDDNGKKMKLIRPSLSEDSGHIMNRIISRVLSPKWVNQQKTYPVKDQCPYIYELVRKNGIPETDKRYKIDKGWQGKEVLIMNVIDRGDMEWHKANKHTKLLAKSVVPGQNGGEFVEEGVSAYAVHPKLIHLIRAYGSWEKYDIAMVRTGKMDNPYTIINATRTPEEVLPASYRQFISEENVLTGEEESWERYDLAKLYAPTSSIKIFNRLKNTIKKIDGALGTDFYKELKDLADAEKAKLEQEAEEKALQNPVVNTPITEVEEAPMEENIIIPSRIEEPVVPPMRERVAVQARPELPYEDTLSDENKALIKSVVKKDDGSYDIVWSCGIDALAGCPTCKTPSPLTATRCPVCGMQF